MIAVCFSYVHISTENQFKLTMMISKNILIMEIDKIEMEKQQHSEIEFLFIFGIFEIDAFLPHAMAASDRFNR